MRQLSMQPKLAGGGRPLNGGNMSPADTAAVVTRARALMKTLPADRLQHAQLAGKNIGLLCARDADDDEAALFRSAAEGLGARVATIRPSLSEDSTPLEIRRTARVLGRLYDALECHGMTAALVGAIEVDAGVPVYAAIASADHPIVELAPLLGMHTPLQDRQRCLVQSVLLGSIF